jgi:hypothetical protein
MYTEVFLRKMSPDTERENDRTQPAFALTEGSQRSRFQKKPQLKKSTAKYWVRHPNKIAMSGRTNWFLKTRHDSPQNDNSRNSAMLRLCHLALLILKTSDIALIFILRKFQRPPAATQLQRTLPLRAQDHGHPHNVCDATLNGE